MSIIDQLVKNEGIGNLSLEIMESVISDLVTIIRSIQWKDEFSCEITSNQATITCEIKTPVDYDTSLYQILFALEHASRPESELPSETVRINLRIIRNNIPYLTHRTYNRYLLTQALRIVMTSIPSIPEQYSMTIEINSTQVSHYVVTMTLAVI